MAHIKLFLLFALVAFATAQGFDGEGDGDAEGVSTGSSIDPSADSTTDLTTDPPTDPPTDLTTDLSSGPSDGPTTSEEPQSTTPGSGTRLSMEIFTLVLACGMPLFIWKTA
ncbi:uncharacterized protein [Periplaneta americana]|uniref:uncharacterized protein isoform X2 n=1 Tax=Periplaneta americana TaxID=6978 RepID=UPI0037E7E0ED